MANSINCANSYVPSTPRWLMHWKPAGAKSSINSTDCVLVFIALKWPATKPLTGPEFVETVERRLQDATSSTARWDVSSVLSVLGEVCGDELTGQVIEDLPQGYALLFGRAELLSAA